MSSARRLVIDIGTNSILALMAEVSGSDIDIIFDLKETARLGEGLAGSGRLSSEAMDRASNAILTFLRRDRYDDVLLIGTEALRAASNANDFLKLIKKQTGLKIAVVSGEKEAFLTFAGALFGMPETGGKIKIIDVGGGSSEISIGIDGDFSHAVSVSVGASRLLETETEDTLEGYRAKAVELIVDQVGGFDPGDIDNLIATGGTITSLAALDRGLKKYDPEAIHGAELSVEQIRSIGSRFEGIDLGARKKLISFDPQRANLILPGAGIFLGILGILNRDQLRVSTGGLRFGAILRPESVSK